MSGDATPNLDLQYLDPSQAQPEVKINDAWNKIDAAVGGGMTIEEVASEHGSPGVIVHNVDKLRIEGATLTAESDGTAFLDITASGVSLTVNDIDESPTASIPNVAKITFRGATVSAESNNGALVHVDYQGVTIGATWVSALGAISVPINDVDRFVAATARITRCTVLTQGGPGSCTIKISKKNLSVGYPPAVGTDDITGGSNVVLASTNYSDNSNLSGWSTLVAPGDVLLFDLSANSNFTAISIFLSLGHDT